MRRFNARRSLALASLIVSFAAVCEMDAADEERELKHYCQMVEGGHWPDFKNLRSKCNDF